MLLKFYDIYVDVSNLFHICYSNMSRNLSIGEPNEKHPDLTPENRCSVAMIKRLNTQTCYEWFKRVNQINKEFRKPKGSTYFLIDAKDDDLNKRQSTRKLLAEHYKQGRTHKTDNFYNLLKLILTLINNLDESFRLVTKPSFEADDLVKPLLEANRIAGEYTSTLLISNDLDWCRDINDTSVHILMDHKVKDLTTLSREKGLNPDTNRIIMYKMLFGDKIDGIFKPETLKGHKKDLMKFLNIMNTPRDLLTLNESILHLTNEKLGQKLISRETYDALYLNYTLINYLDFDGHIDDSTTFCKFNKELLLRYIKHLYLEPNKIQLNLATKLDFFKKKSRKMGMKS